jgi:hypothetical protein
MDHYCPSYFALTGPLDRAKLAENVIPEPYARILKTLSASGVRYLLAGDMPLALHGIPRMPEGVDLLLDPVETNLRCFLETLGSEGFLPDEAAFLALFQGEESMTSNCLRLSDNSGLWIRVLINTPVTYGEAFQRRISVPSGSQTIDVLSLDDLVSIKSGTSD